VLLAGLGLALLLPVVPFVLELFALRRLTSAAFGTLMSLEPAIALAVGLLLLHQLPGWVSVAGIGLVVAAGIGAERTGARASLQSNNWQQVQETDFDHCERDRPLTAPAPTAAPRRRRR
jgi:threonine/homoserine efflux transporter RhtA